MKRKRRQEYSDEEKSSKRQKVDHPPSNSTNSPPPPQDAPPNALPPPVGEESQVDETQPPRATSQRRSVLEERENPSHLSFQEFNEERRKRKLKSLNRPEFDFLQENQSWESWQYQLDGIKEEILDFYERAEFEYYTYVDVLDEIVEEPHSAEFLEGKTVKTQRSCVNSQLNTLWNYGFLERKTKKGRKGGESPSFSLRYFEGIQKYQYIPIISRKNAVLYSLTFTNKVMTRNDIVEDINTRVFTRKEFRLEGEGIISNCGSLYRCLQQLEKEKVVKYEKHMTKYRTSSIVTYFYYISDRTDLDRSSIPPKPPSSEDRKNVILEILRNSESPMTTKEIHASSSELAVVHVERTGLDLKKLCEEGVLTREKRDDDSYRSPPYEYSINDEESQDEDEEDDEEEGEEEKNVLLIPPPPPDNSVTLPPPPQVLPPVKEKVKLENPNDEEENWLSLVLLPDDDLEN